MLGLPGNPVSALVTFELFARPLIRRMLGLTGSGRRDAAGGRRRSAWRRTVERRAYLRVIVTRGAGRLEAQLGRRAGLVAAPPAGRRQRPAGGAGGRAGRRGRRGRTMRSCWEASGEAKPPRPGGRAAHGRRRRQAGHRAPARWRAATVRMRPEVLGAAARCGRPEGRRLRRGAAGRHRRSQAHRRADPALPSTAARPRRGGAHAGPDGRARSASAPRSPPPHAPGSRWRR